MRIKIHGYYLLGLLFSAHVWAIVLSSSVPVSGGGSFDAAVTQSTQQGLQVFTDVKASKFLKMSSDQDFSSSDDDKKDLPVDLKDGDVPAVSVSEALGGDWNG